MENNSEKKAINEIYIGKNGTGKTFALEKYVLDILNKIKSEKTKSEKTKSEKTKSEKTKDKNNDNISEDKLIYIESEQIWSKEINKDKATLGGNWIYRLARFAESLFNLKANAYLKLDKENLNNFLPKRNDSIDEFNKSFKKLNNSSDDDFIFNFEESIKHTFDFKTLSFSFEQEFINKSSGQNFYSLIKLIVHLLKKHNDNDLSDYYFFIDEPEKFLHPNLIVKIAILLKEISKANINVVIVSHSALFISNFIDEEKTTIKLFKKKDKSTEDLKFSDTEEFKFSDTEEFKFSDVINYSKQNVNCSKENSGTYSPVSYILMNQTLRLNFIESLMSDNILLVEGETDKIFFKLIISNEEKLFNKNIYVMNCNGYSNFEYWYNVYKNLKYNFYIIHDDDQNKSKIKFKDSKQYYKFLKDFLNELNFDEIENYTHTNLFEKNEKYNKEKNEFEKNEFEKNELKIEDQGRFKSCKKYDEIKNRVILTFKNDIEKSFFISQNNKMNAGNLSIRWSEDQENIEKISELPIIKEITDYFLNIFEPNKLPKMEISMTIPMEILDYNELEKMKKT